MHLQGSGVMTTLLGLCTAGIALAVPLDIRQTVDPGVEGPYTPSTPTEYTLDDVLLPQFPLPMEMQAVVVGPVDAPGSRPLVVFLHGRSFTCYTPRPDDPTNYDSGASQLISWPCPQGQLTYPSHLGYNQTQHLLATQGYLSVSILATGIHGQESAFDLVSGSMARSNLVRMHLSLWADWAGAGRPQAPQVVQDLPPADMTQVLLVGHSRGGEGVNRATIDSLTAPAPEGEHADIRGKPATWSIKGQFLIGPQLNGQNPAPDTPSASLLPGCDGDITRLEGELWLDGTRGVSRGLALHAGVFVEYANHNWFNSVWLRDNGAHDPTCQPGAPNRLSRATQLAVGATYVAAAARLFLDGDATILPLLDGSPVSAPPSVSPAHIHTHAVGANRATLLLPADTTVVTGTGSRLCELVPAQSDSPSGCRLFNSPHAIQFTYVTPTSAISNSIQPEPGRYAVALTWTAAGTKATISTGTRNISGNEQVALRVVVPQDSTGTQLEAAIVDTSNRRFTLGQFTLNGLPNAFNTAFNELSQEVRLSLSGSSSSGVDLTQIASLELTPRSTSGSAWVIDAWGWRNGFPDPQTVALPRVDLGEITVLEGSGTTTRTLSVPVRGSSTSNGVLRVFVVDPANVATASIVTVTPGMTSFNVPVTVVGDTQPGANKTYVVAAKAVQGIMVGDAFGAVLVDDDD